MNSAIALAILIIPSVSSIAPNGAADPPVSAACAKLNQTFATELANGQFKEGESALSAALASGAYRAEDACTGLLLNNMAGLMSALGRSAEAERFAQQSVTILEKVPNDPVLLRSLQILAAIRFEQGEKAAARQAFRKMQSLPIQRPEDSAIVHAMAAALLQAEDRGTEAEAEYLAAIRAWGEAGRGERADTGDILNGLASLYIKEQRLDEARQTLDRALAIFSRAKDSVPLDRVKLLVLRGALYARLGDWQQSEQDLCDALSLVDREPSVDPALLRSLLSHYSYALRKNHHRREARFIEARTAALPTNHTAAVVDLTDLLVEKNAAKRSSIR
jgi:tetratricopeptide (TPR) repeat protein